MLVRLASAAIKIQYHTRKFLMANHFYPTETEEFNQSQSEMVESYYDNQSKVIEQASVKKQIENIDNIIINQRDSSRKDINMTSSLENLQKEGTGQS